MWRVWCIFLVLCILFKVENIIRGCSVYCIVFVTLCNCHQPCGCWSNSLIVVYLYDEYLYHHRERTNTDFDSDIYCCNIRCKTDCKEMMTSSNGNIFRLTGHLCGEFTGHRTQRPVTRSFDVFFDLRLNKRLSKQLQGWWFKTLPRLLWRHCNEMIIFMHNNHGPCSQFIIN